MSGWFSESVLLLAALFSFFTPASSDVFPRQFAARSGLAISGVSGYNEIRAQYSGFFDVPGAICVAALVGCISRRFISGMHVRKRPDVRRECIMMGRE